MNEKYLAVTSPVADIRRKPVESLGGYMHDDLQETQVLYNELLLYRHCDKDWYYVEAIEQKKFTHDNSWAGYSGWIKNTSVVFLDKPVPYDVTVKNHDTFLLEEPSDSSNNLSYIPIGTRLAVKESSPKGYYRVFLNDGKTGWIKQSAVNKKNTLPSLSTLRENIASTAIIFLGVPYLWGGRSMVSAKAKEFDVVCFGVDCSGLTNLVFRINNIDIPRDAQDQWIMAENIAHKHLKTGDLIFLSAEDRKDRIVHVMIYLGKNLFIEALETGSSVKMDDFRNRFGIDMTGDVYQNPVVNGKHMYFGRFLSEK